MQQDPTSVTADDANYLKSREARATGQAQPPKDSVSADAQRLAAANEQGAAPKAKTGPLSPAEQSHLTKERNLEQTVNEVASKDPSQITQDDANLLHSREQRAHGHTEKGGVASQAKTIANENTRS